MAFSIRGLFGVSAIAAIFLAAIYSRSDLAVLFATLLFAIMILLGTTLAFVSKQPSTFWRAFAVVAIGLVWMSQHIALFEQLAISINASIRPPVPAVWTTVPPPTPYPPSSYSTPTLSTPSSSVPVTSPSVTYSAPVPPLPSGSPTYPVPVLAAPVSVYNYSTGRAIDMELEKLLILGSALLIGLICAVVMDVLVAKTKDKA